MQDHSESRLHIAAVQYLRGEIRNGKNVIKVQRPFDCLFLHPVNEFKDEKEGFWGKAKGILPGAADLLFWWKCNDPKFGAIELKTKSSQSPAQRQFQQDFESHGGRYAICRTVASVRDQLIAWGLACKNKQCIEPRLSHEELLALQVEIYRP